MVLVLLQKIFFGPETALNIFKPLASTACGGGGDWDGWLKIIIFLLRSKNTFCKKGEIEGDDHIYAQVEWSGGTFYIFFTIFFVDILCARNATTRNTWMLQVTVLFIPKKKNEDVFFLLTYIHLPPNQSSFCVCVNLNTRKMINVLKKLLRYPMLLLQFAYIMLHTSTKIRGCMNFVVCSTK